jgi:hypothetical protein
MPLPIFPAPIIPIFFILTSSSYRANHRSLVLEQDTSLADSE